MDTGNGLIHDVDFVRDWLTPVIIAGSIITAGIITQRAIILYIRRYEKETRWKGGQVFVHSLRWMIFLISALVGTYVGLTRSPLSPETLNTIKKLHNGLIIFIFSFILARIISGLFRVYSLRGEGTKRSLSLLNTIINIIIYSVGGVIILDSLGISITPILTAMGVGGLAVALALQDTLSNLFAGIYITSSRYINLGDYITLSSGEEGNVVDITWRCTMLLNLNNSTVIIPNSKLISTTVSRNKLPVKSQTVNVNWMVRNDGDLEKIEKLTLEVASAVVEELKIENEDKPVFRYKEFSESSVKFIVTFTWRNYGQQDFLCHTFIKRLQKKFKDEGIPLPYSVRDVHLTKYTNPTPNIPIQ